MSEAAPLLELRNVTAGYAQDIDVLREIDLRVDAGRITGLIGLNGAGKSTLVKTICGFLPPKSGSVRFRGEDISGIEPHRLIDRGICCIPQESSLFAYLSVQQNLMLPLLGRPKRYDAAMRSRLQEVLRALSGAAREAVERRPEASRAASRSSSNSRRPGCSSPALCLIDEPSIGLAPGSPKRYSSGSRSSRSANMGILLIDHNVRRVVRMSDRVCVLSLGRITAAGRAAEFQGNLHQQVQEWLGLHF